MSGQHVVVVGGGISGLAAAVALVDAGATVTVLEASPRLGGAIETVGFAGQQVDTGPDSFLARRPEMIDFATRLGLGDELVAPATGAAAVWSRGALRRLPDKLVLGVPASLGTLAASGIVSTAGLGRAALDLVLPRTPVGADIGVGDLVRRRFGAEVHERLVDPLLGGIHAGRSETLSAAVAAPQLLETARRTKSLLRALAAQSPSANPGAPVFLTPRNGLGAIVSAAAAELRGAGAEIRVSTPVAQVRARRSGVAVEMEDGTVDADAAVLATRAPVTAQLLAQLGEATDPLRALRYASVVLTLLSYPADALAEPFSMSGFLVPRVEGKLLTAASWASSKWAHLGGEAHIVRASCGRIDDERVRDMSDDAIVAAVHEELAAATGLRGAPTATRVVRWPDALPQFAVGHLERTAALHATVADQAPRVAVAGAAYEGLGLPACVASGRAAAERVLLACREGQP